MAPVASNASVASVSTERPPLRIFYDRLAVALLGCLAVLTLVVGGVLALAGVFSGWVPLIAMLLAVASFSTLRGLAVRDRRGKLLAKLETTRTRALETGRSPLPEPVKKPAVVFDAQPDSNKRAPQLTVQELRAEALRIAQKGAAVQRPEGWEPTEVPLPQYVVANAARRPSPAPLRPEEELKASTNATLRAQEAAARVAAARVAEATAGAGDDAAAVQAIPAVQAPVVQTPAAEESAATPAPATGQSGTAAKPAAPETPAARGPRAEAPKDRINLDDVMQRRRA